MKHHQKRKGTALILGFVGSVVLGYTLRLLYDLGVYADETGTSGFRYAVVGWSLAALSLLLLVSALLLWTRNREK